MGDDWVSFSIKSTLVRSGRVLQLVQSWPGCHSIEHITWDFLQGQFFLLLQHVWHLQGVTGVSGELIGGSVVTGEIDGTRVSGEPIGGSVVTGEILSIEVVSELADNVIYT